MFIAFDFLRFSFTSAMSRADTRTGRTIWAFKSHNSESLIEEGWDHQNPLTNDIILFSRQDLFQEHM